MYIVPLGLLLNNTYECIASPFSHFHVCLWNSGYDDWYKDSMRKWSLILHNIYTNLHATHFAHACLLLHAITPGCSSCVLCSLIRCTHALLLQKYLLQDSPLAANQSKPKHKRNARSRELSNSRNVAQVRQTKLWISTEYARFKPAKLFHFFCIIIHVVYSSHMESLFDMSESILKSHWEDRGSPSLKS